MPDETQAQTAMSAGEAGQGLPARLAAPEALEPMRPFSGARARALTWMSQIDVGLAQYLEPTRPSRKPPRWGLRVGFLGGGRFG
jgi:hypothetical protein